MLSNGIGRRARIAAMASALAFALGSGALLAQPGPGAGFGHGGGRGPGAGPWGGPGGDHLGQVMAHVKSQLNLDSSQQQMWDNAVAASKSAREGSRALRQQVHDQIKAELAKQEPNMETVAAMIDGAQTQAQALRKPARDAWLTLYRNLQPQQKAVVRDALLARMQRHEQMRERFQQRFGTQSPAQ